MAQPTYTLEELSRKVDAISEFLNEKTDRNLLNLNTVGQAIIDGKVEVEALLEQNGYAKFTWKEDNKVANLIIQWGFSTRSGTGNKNIILPLSYTTTNTYHVAISLNSSDGNAYNVALKLWNNSSSSITTYTNANQRYDINWISIGY